MPIKGRWESAGFLSTVRISQSDCDMVRILRDLGAVFYVKTNQPQAIMHLEAQSTMGRTVRPFSLFSSQVLISSHSSSTRTTSVSLLAAPLAAKERSTRFAGPALASERSYTLSFSLFDIVTDLSSACSDIGGSIRNPAANNGIYGMRPSCHTMPMEGYKF